jgi:predicted small secreted protein
MKRTGMTLGMLLLVTCAMVVAACDNDDTGNA